MKPNLIGIIAAGVLAVAGISYGLYSHFWEKPPEREKPAGSLQREEMLALKKNILVLGTDDRPKDDDPGRSDTLFVVMFDTAKKTVSLLSIPRDTRVWIPEYDYYDKINHAYSYGGRKLTEKTVEEFLGIRIDNYVQVDFKGFKGVVDAIGGVDIDVEEDMYYYDEWDDFLIDLKKGPQHLDGEKAIEYVRYRDEEGDIGRIKRQQHFLMAVYDRITSAGMLVRIPGLSMQINSMIDTNLPFTDMLDIGKALLTMVREKGISAATVPGTPEDIDEVNYWIPDMVALRAEMAKMQGAEMTGRYRAAAEAAGEEYARSLKDAAEEREEKPAAKRDDAGKKELQKEDVKKRDAERVEGRRKDKGEKKPPQKPAAKPSQKPAAKPPQKPGKEQQPGVATAPAAQGAAAAKDDARRAAAKEEAARGSGRTTVLLINRSGSSTDGANARARLENAGFTVIDGGSGAAENETVVIATTNNGAVVARLTKIPFPHKTRIDKDGGADCDGIVILGRDFK